MIAACASLMSLTVAIGLSPQSARAQKPVNASASVTPGAVIHLRLQSGSVRLSGWEHDSVHVSGMLAPGESWAMRTDGDTVRLRAEGIPRGLAAPSELEIFVPRRSVLIVRAAAASLVVRDFDHTVDVATAAGNLLVEAVRGTVRAESMQGTLTVLGPIPRVEASTASGALLVSVPYDTINDTVYARRSANNRTASNASRSASANAANVSSPFGVVILRSVSGRITFDAPHVDSATIHNVRGDVRVVTSPSDSGRVYVTSHTGRVTVGWTLDTHALIDAITQRGGVRGRLVAYAMPASSAQPSPLAGAEVSMEVDVETLLTKTPSGVRVTHALRRLPAAPLFPILIRVVRGDIVFERVDVRPAP
jgi:hypothetical protein